MFILWIFVLQQFKAREISHWHNILCMCSPFPLCRASILKMQIVSWDTWTILDLFSVDSADEKEDKTA